MEQIFNTFFTSKPQGTGMGLPISRSSSNRTAGICGLFLTRDQVPHFNSPYLFNVPRARPRSCHGQRRFDSARNVFSTLEEAHPQMQATKQP